MSDTCDLAATAACQAIRNGLGPMFECMDKGEYIRVRTPYLYPDGDFIDLDWTTPELRAPRPLLVLFHGLEGSSESRYARALMQAAIAQQWQGVVVHFRGCSGEENRQPRAYHSGDSVELD